DACDNPANPARDDIRRADPDWVGRRKSATRAEVRVGEISARRLVAGKVRSHGRSVALVNLQFRRSHYQSPSMLNSLNELLIRLDRISGQPGAVRDDMREAIVSAERDSVASSVRARRVLDHIVRQVFERHIKEPAGSRPMEQILTRIVKEGHFPDDLAG